MGIIAIALVLGLIFQIIYWRVTDNSFFDGWWILAVCFFAGLLLGLFINGDYYESEEPEVVKIAGIEYLDIESSDGARYISRNSDNSYTYIRQVYDEGGHAIWEPAQIPAGTPFIIVERDEYTEPVLNIYRRGYKKNFWTFSIGGTKEEYVFRLPVSDKLPITDASNSEDPSPQFEDPGEENGE